MYFPILRGKQFELIALRELLDIIPDNAFIRPIIEPVKEKTTTYKITIEKLQESNINFTIIINPSVGNVKNNFQETCSELLPNSDYKNFQIGIIINTETDLVEISGVIEAFKLSKYPIVVILESVFDDSIDDIIDFLGNYKIANILVSSEIRNRRSISRRIKKLDYDLISLSDSFVKLARNKDYSSKVDDFFSEEHLYFTEEGFVGYSDYLTIGKEYSDKGYSPYAVAIHLTYLVEEDLFRIHHFVSDSNEDYSDVAGKFEEAMNKLIPFIDDKDIKTTACSIFRSLNEEKKYPGLGTVKKLSILNHLELVYIFFS